MAVADEGPAIADIKLRRQIFPYLEHAVGDTAGRRFPCLIQQARLDLLIVGGLLF